MGTKCCKYREIGRPIEAGKKNTSLSVVTGQGPQLGHIFVSVESIRRPSSGDDSGSEFQSEDLDSERDSERDRDKKQVRLIFVRNPVMCLVDQ
ncbi:hypothetical protein SDJN02_24505, partial [Cucurbita argyrosperma subsp. argyrosperma]